MGGRGQETRKRVGERGFKAVGVGQQKRDIEVEAVTAEMVVEWVGRWAWK